MLSIGAKSQVLFRKNDLISAILPGEVSNILVQVQQLGLSKEVDKFTNTLTNAVSETATTAVPIFLSGITKMKFKDGVSIVKNGGTSATDYLRRTVGDSLRRSVTPVMKTALDKYHVTEQWNVATEPVKLFLGDKLKLNLNLENILAGLVTNAMFNKIAEKEMAVRSKAEARTSQLLQKVFGSIATKNARLYQ